MQEESKNLLLSIYAIAKNGLKQCNDESQNRKWSAIITEIEIVAENEGINLA